MYHKVLDDKQKTQDSLLFMNLSLRFPDELPSYDIDLLKSFVESHSCFRTEHTHINEAEGTITEMSQIFVDGQPRFTIKTVINPLDVNTINIRTQVESDDGMEVKHYNIITKTKGENYED